MLNNKIYYVKCNEKQLAQISIINNVQPLQKTTKLVICILPHKNINLTNCLLMLDSYSNKIKINAVSTSFSGGKITNKINNNKNYLSFNLIANNSCYFIIELVSLYKQNNKQSVYYTITNNILNKKLVLSIKKSALAKAPKP